MNRKNHDLRFRRTEIDRVGKALQDTSTRFATNARKGQGALNEAADEVIDVASERIAKPSLPLVVPAPNLENLGRGLRSKDDCEAHPRLRSFCLTTDQGMAVSG